MTDVLFEKLLSTYDYNRLRVEEIALDTVSSFEIAVFNGLRNASIQRCFSALYKLEKLFGRRRTIEHCICLCVLTEYLSVSFINTALYETFKTSFSYKFLENFFFKLFNEWKLVFLADPPIEFSSFEQYQGILKIFNNSFNRFPETFPFISALRNVVQLSKTFQYTKISTDNSLTPVLSTNSKVIQSDSFKFKSAQPNNRSVISVPQDNYSNNSLAAQSKFKIDMEIDDCHCEMCKNTNKFEKENKYQTNRFVFSQSNVNIEFLQSKKLKTDTILNNVSCKITKVPQKSVITESVEREKAKIIQVSRPTFSHPRVVNTNEREIMPTSINPKKSPVNAFDVLMKRTNPKNPVH